MTIRIVNEGSSAVFTITFTDDNDTPVTPETSYWQLMKKDGTVVDPHSFTNGSFTGNVVTIPGSSLILDSTADIVRIFAVKGTYNSNLGSGLAFSEEVEFNIRNLYSQP
jgi:hypothetical protein